MRERSAGRSRMRRMQAEEEEVSMPCRRSVPGTAMGGEAHKAEQTA